MRVRKAWLRLNKIASGIKQRILRVVPLDSSINPHCGPDAVYGDMVAGLEEAGPVILPALVHVSHPTLKRDCCGKQNERRHTAEVGDEPVSPGRRQVFSNLQRDS